MADEETPPAEGEESTAQVGDPDPQDKEAEAEATEAVEDYDSAEDAAEEAAPKPRMSHVKLATIAGLVLVLVLGGLTGWLGYRAYESRQAEDVRNLFLQVGGRQAR